MVSVTPRRSRPNPMPWTPLYWNVRATKTFSSICFSTTPRTWALYPVFQKYFRDDKPPLVAIWGKHDPFFLPPGAEAYRRDNPNATVELLDTGHFALEPHVEQIAAAIRRFMAQVNMN